MRKKKKAKAEKMRGGGECQDSSDCDWPKDRCVWPGECV